MPYIIKTVDAYLPKDNGKCHCIVSRSTQHLSIDQGEVTEEIVNASVIGLFDRLYRWIQSQNLTITKLPRKGNISFAHCYSEVLIYNRSLKGDEFYFLHYKGMDIKVEKTLWDYIITVTVGVTF